jgi:RNA polymerase sigma-70 factor (ECF subfamily)
VLLERTDRDIVEACRRGERDAFRELFERHKDRVYSIALRYSGDQAVAMDIAQDTFLKLFSGIQSFRGESSFDSWLYRLVVNSCLDQKRKTRRLAPLLGALIDALPAPEPSADERVIRAEMGGQVRSVVAGLPPEQRIAIVLRYTQGLSYDEIAEATGCSAGTVASRLNRAHRTLERRLARFRGKNGGPCV